MDFTKFKEMFTAKRDSYIKYCYFNRCSREICENHKNLSIWFHKIRKLSWNKSYAQPGGRERTPGMEQIKETGVIYESSIFSNNFPKIV